MRQDSEEDLGLGAMMARNVSATTSRGRDSAKDKASKRISRSRSRSSSVRRKSKKKDDTPDAPKRSKSQDDETRSISSRKSTKSSRSKKIRRAKSADGVSKPRSSSRLRKPLKASNSEIAPRTSESSIDDDEKKEKKKSKKIRRVRRSGAETDSGEDEYTVSSKQSARSSRSSKSSRSKISRLKSKSGSSTSKNKVSKQYNETSSRVEAIREPVLSNEGVILKDEMDNLFPLPMDNGNKAGKTKRNGSSISSDNDKQPKSILAGSSKSLNSTSNHSAFGIMTNKAAAASAEAALSRVAAMDVDAPAPERRERMSRRNSNSSWRSKDQYNRLHRDSGLTSMTSLGDDDERSLRSQRSANNLSAMTALQKRMDEYKSETENLQKRLYEALAELEQSNKKCRDEKERADAAEGQMSGANEELEKIKEEKEFLIESVRDMENEFEKKGERVLELQEVVETQLDTVEFLEDKLNKTEEELVLMEEEITELIDVVEEKNKTSEQIKEAKSKGQGRVAKMVSMREDLNKRKNSISEQVENSRRVLSSSGTFERTSKNSLKMAPVSESSGDIEKLQKELKAREAKLKDDLDECKNREQRLDTWEKELFDLEDQLKKENERISASSKEASSANSQHEALIASLQEDKEGLRKTQIETQSKLKALQFENDNLQVKLERVTKMATENHRQIPVKNNDLENAKALVEKKEQIIKSLEEKVAKLEANGGGSNQAEEEAKDLLIRELQNQLVTAKKEASSLSSGTYVTRLKLEIKKLRENVRDLKKNLKEADTVYKGNLQKKDDAMRLLEKQMTKLKIELERRDKREKNFGAENNRIADSDLQAHIDDLEDEISHWKSTNADLENEIEDLKARADAQPDFYQSDDDIDDDNSIGSLASVNSRMSLSMHDHDNFFLTDTSTHSMSLDRSTHSVGEPQTPNRALRTVSNLWSKITNAPEPPSANVSFPYGPGTLND